MNSKAPELEALQAAVSARDVEALRSAVGAAHLSSDAVPILARVLLEDWHDAHEDIAFELGLIGDRRAVDVLVKAARIPFAHLVEWGNLQSFQRKCAYALARIGSPEARTALETLAFESDPKLREYAREGLSKWPLPYRP